MSKTIIIRWLFSLVLLVCVWLGYAWAIKLSITLSLIAFEMMAYTYKGNKNESY